VPVRKRLPNKNLEKYLLDALRPAYTLETERKAWQTTRGFLREVRDALDDACRCAVKGMKTNYPY